MVQCKFCHEESLEWYSDPNTGKWSLGIKVDENAYRRHDCPKLKRRNVVKSHNKLTKHELKKCPYCPLGYGWLQKNNVKDHMFVYHRSLEYLSIDDMKVERNSYNMQVHEVITDA